MGKTCGNILFAIILTLTPAVVNAQTVAGKLVDESGAPVAYANIVAMSLPDSAFVNGAVSKDDGTFMLDTKGKGRLFRITSMGYKTLYKPFSQDLGVITLQTDARILGEVVVKSQLPKTSVKNGGMVTTVVGTMLERAGSIENLLDRIPNVTAKKGAIEVFGRGTPVIYINGRQLRDKAELGRLKSDDIKNVEVITTPGARYAASVTSVIRITTKKPVGEGFGVSPETYVDVNDPGDWSAYQNLNMTYRKGGFEATGRLFGSSDTKPDDKQLQQFTYLDKTWHQVNPINMIQKTKSFYSRLGLSYMFNPENSIGASISFNRNPDNNYEGKLYSDLFKDDVLTETSTSLLGSFEQTTSWNGNAYYSGKLGKIGIDLNVDWLKNDDKEFNHTDERFTPSGQAEQSRNVKTNTGTHNRLIASKLVLTYPLFGGEIGLGGEYSHSRRTTFYQALPTGIVDDDDSKIREGMTSSFIDYRRKFGVLDVRAGLRYEYVDFDYYEHGLRISDQSRTFSNMFPSISLTMPAGKSVMQLSYASDIKRPSYFSLRSSVLYANRYTYETGNPFLVPTISRNLSYMLSYKWLTFSAIYTHVTDPEISYGVSYNGQPDILLLTRKNGNSFNKVLSSVSLSPEFGIWHPSLQLYLLKQWFRMDTHEGNMLGNPKATFRFNNTLTTKLCDITMLMTAQTEGNDENVRATRYYFNTDLILYKSLMKGRLTLQLDINNLFHTGDQYLRIYYGSQRTMDIAYYNHTDVALTVRYNLNSTKSKYRGTGAGKSQKSRM